MVLGKSFTILFPVGLRAAAGLSLNSSFLRERPQTIWKWKQDGLSFKKWNLYLSIIRHDE